MEEGMDRFSPCVYILSSKPRGVLYTGVTSNLVFRVWQHKHKLVPGFTTKYNADRLVWFELHGDIEAAIVREKQIKRWKRAWKIALIEASNPQWQDRFEEISG